MPQNVHVSTGNPMGCLMLIITCMVLWGACFGVTVNGKHHEINCSCDDGVSVQSTPKP